MNSTNPFQLHLIDFFSSPAAHSIQQIENLSFVEGRARQPNQSTLFFLFDGASAGRQKKERVVGLAAQLLLLGAPFDGAGNAIQQ